MPRAIIAAALTLVAGCSSSSPGSKAAANQPRAIVNADSPRPTIDLLGVPDRELIELGTLNTREEWTAVLKISAGPDEPALVGQYSIENGRVRFTPMFPLDHGRQYHVAFLPPGGQPVTATVALPAPDTTPVTSVAAVYPTGDAVPENQLRLYLQFSAPMSPRVGLDSVHWFDESGRDVPGAFLPLDAEFWNDDRTRYTVFFDPARQRRGSVGEGVEPSLMEGRTYTLVVDSAWKDANGLPLKSTYKRTLSVGPPDERPIDPKAWKIFPPAAHAISTLRIVFPEPLDRGLLLSALGVLGPDRRQIEGIARVGDNEVEWSFTTDEPWKPGAYTVVASGELEDLAGNGIGTTFDVDQFDRTDTPAATRRQLLPFVVR